MKYVLNKKEYSPEEFSILNQKKLSKAEKKKRHRERSLKDYYANKSKWLARIKDWKRRNPEKCKAYRKNTFSKWYYKEGGKKWMVDYMKKYYHKHKDKQRSRSTTYKLKSYLKPKCNNCGTKDKLKIRHEIYPLTKPEIIKAIKKKKIYYLCSKCHDYSI